MKKVIFAAPHFLPHLGGLEKHVAAVAKVLSKREWNIEIVTIQESPDQAVQEKLSYCQVTRIPIDDQKTKKTMWNWHKNYFKKVSSDTIIHIHDVGWWFLPQLLFGSKNNFYITFHGWEGIYPIRWQAKLHRWLIASLVKKTIHVGDFIKWFYWDKPTAVTYGGVDLPITTSIMKPELPRIKIVFLGRLEKENSIESYLILLTELTQLKLQIEIVWIGDGSYRSISEKWGKVTGMVKDVRTPISTADLVFASSYLSMLEAEAIGKIVCALHDNQLKKVYIETFPGKNGVLSSDNPKELARQILELVHNPEKFIQLSKKNAVFGQSQTWNLVADTYEELWRVR